jgi:hypothetical protein
MHFCCSSPPDVRFLRRRKMRGRCLRRRLRLPLPRANLRRRNRRMHLLARLLRERLLRRDQRLVLER